MPIRPSSSLALSPRGGNPHSDSSNEKAVIAGRARAAGAACRSAGADPVTRLRPRQRPRPSVPNSELQQGARQHADRHRRVQQLPRGPRRPRSPADPTRARGRPRDSGPRRRSRCRRARSRRHRTEGQRSAGGIARRQRQRRRPDRDVGGEAVEPGDNGLFDLASASNDLPMPLLVALIAIGRAWPWPACSSRCAGASRYSARMPLLSKIPARRVLPSRTLLAPLS